MSAMLIDRSLDPVCEAMCRAILQGQEVFWQLGDSPEHVAAFLDCARYHGVQGLVFQRLGLLCASPPSLLPRLREAVAERTAWEVRDRELLRHLLGEFVGAGVDAVLFKGAALAYSLYDNPVWRSRTDTDLLIREEDLALAQELLVRSGYAALPEGESIIYYQRDYILVAPEGGRHHVDLHWRINNSEVLSRLFSHQELLAEAEPLAGLGPHARRASDVHSLLIASFHRRVHASYTDERYVWLLDIDLLARGLQPAQWAQLVTLAMAKGMAATLSEALSAAQALLGTPLPVDIATSLSAALPGPCDRYFEAGSTRRLLFELQACKGLPEQLSYLRRGLLPTGAYMLSRYEDAWVRWLPWLYVRRALSGSLKLAGFRRSGV